MGQEWQAQPQGGAAVFTPGNRVDAFVQSVMQHDGYRHEISYWYDGQDIYVLFHCYSGHRNKD
jgi:hypothetical protein